MDLVKITGRVASLPVKIEGGNPAAGGPDRRQDRAGVRTALY